MKKLISLLIISVMALTLFTSCADNTGDYKEPPTEKTTASENIKTVTIAARNNKKTLNINYDTEKIDLVDSYSSEATFAVGENDENYPNKSFGVTFISEMTAQDDYKASLGDASSVIVFSALEECNIAEGKLIYYYDESWYGEFKTRYYLYVFNGDLIKIIIKEQISDEQIKYYLDLLEF